VHPCRYQCFAVVFFAVEADVTARQVARLLQPFVTPGCPLRLVLQECTTVIDDLLLTDVGQVLDFPLRDMGGQQAATETKLNRADGAGSLFCGAGDSLLTELARDGLADLVRRNASLLRWRKRVAVLLSPLSEQSFLMIVQPDRTVLNLMLANLDRGLDVLHSAASRSHHETLDAKHSKFYEKLDHFVHIWQQRYVVSTAVAATTAPSSSTRSRVPSPAVATPARSAKPSRASPSTLLASPRGESAPPTPSGERSVSLQLLPWVIIKHADLLSPEEMRSILYSLQKASIKAVICLSSLNPVAMRIAMMMDTTVSLEQLVVNFSHTAPPPDVDELSRDVLDGQPPPPRLKAALLAASAILGRHFSGDVARAIVQLLALPLTESVAATVQAVTSTMHERLVSFSAPPCASLGRMQCKSFRSLNCNILCS
jgi:hypothetical protein